MRLQVFGIFIGGIDIFDTFPFIRSLTCAYTDGVSVEIGLVDMQTQTVHTVAPEPADEIVGIFTGSLQRVAGYRVAALYVRPYIRHLSDGYIHCAVSKCVRIYVQSQLYDTVATVPMACQSIVVNAAFVQITRGVLTGQTEAYRITFTNGIYQYSTSDYRQYFDVYRAYAVIAFCSQRIVNQVTCIGDIIAILPCERSLA